MHHRASIRQALSRSELKLAAIYWVGMSVEHYQDECLQCAEQSAELLEQTGSFVREVLCVYKTYTISSITENTRKVRKKCQMIIITMG